MRDGSRTSRGAPAAGAASASPNTRTSPPMWPSWSTPRSSGAVRVTTATAAIDAGQVVNPNGLINQTEGGIIQATSWTLKERVGFDRGGIISRDWQGYPILTFPEVPVVSVTVLDRPTEKSLGAGEAAQGPTAAAIANAVAHATGARLRDLPLAPERVKAAAFG